MKKIIAFKPHSFIDVITNSSSELFIGKANKDVDTIKELLVEALNLHNKVNNSSLEFDKVFSDVYVPSDVDQLLHTFVGFGMPYNLSGIFNKYDTPPNYDPNCSWEESEQREIDWVASISKEDKKALTEYIVIESAGDNSIPYELFDIISNMINGDRIHLG